MRTLSHEFVEFIPEIIENGKVYISITYATVVHKCCCGCGKRVVTPLTPTDWKLIYDGESISLSPSIGNWQYPCKSHYFIIENQVKWAKSWEEMQEERTLELKYSNKKGTKPKNDKARALINSILRKMNL